MCLPISPHLQIKNNCSDFENPAYAVQILLALLFIVDTVGVEPKQSSCKLVDLPSASDPNISYTRLCKTSVHLSAKKVRRPSSCRAFGSSPVPLYEIVPCEGIEPSRSTCKIETLPLHQQGWSRFFKWLTRSHLCKSLSCFFLNIVIPGSICYRRVSLRYTSYESDFPKVFTVFQQLYKITYFCMFYINPTLGAFSVPNRILFSKIAMCPHNIYIYLFPRQVTLLTSSLKRRLPTLVCYEGV